MRIRWWINYQERNNKARLVSSCLVSILFLYIFIYIYKYISILFIYPLCLSRSQWVLPIVPPQDTIFVSKTGIIVSSSLSKQAFEIINRRDNRRNNNKDTDSQALSIKGSAKVDSQHSLISRLSEFQCSWFKTIISLVVTIFQLKMFKCVFVELTVSLGNRLDFMWAACLRHGHAIIIMHGDAGRQAIHEATLILASVHMRYIQRAWVMWKRQHDEEKISQQI
jgi:hypothetical protein